MTSVIWVRQVSNYLILVASVFKEATIKMSLIPITQQSFRCRKDLRTIQRSRVLPVLRSVTWRK